MSHFLAVVQKTVVDTPEDPGDPTATPPVPPTPAVTHKEIANVHVETNAVAVTEDLLAQDANPDRETTEWFSIKFAPGSLQPTLHKVSLKAGPRAPAPAREVAEIEAIGEGVVGSAIV
jgi:hypothetical protein